MAAEPVSTRPIPVALIGCGRVVETGHVPAYAASSEVEVVAVCDPSRERRDAVGGALGVPASRRFADPAALAGLAEPPQAAVVATPTATHRALIGAALAAGLHVVSEKPVSPTPAETLALHEAAAAAGRRLSVLHNYLSVSTWREVARRLQDGAVGAPRRFEVSLADPGPLPGFSPGDPNWRADRALAGGGCLLDAGYHYFYLAEALMGSPIEAVRSCKTERRNGWDLEDVVVAELVHADGAATVIAVDWTADPGRPPEHRVIGADGEIELDEEAMTVAVRPRGGPESVHECTADPHGYHDTLPRTIAATVTGADRPSAPTGRRVANLIEACYESSRTGDAVPLSREPR